VLSRRRSREFDYFDERSYHDDDSTDLHVEGASHDNDDFPDHDDDGIDVNHPPSLSTGERRPRTRR
jgi:hypothetical protein